MNYVNIHRIILLGKFKEKIKSSCKHYSDISVLWCNVKYVNKQWVQFAET